MTDLDRLAVFIDYQNAYHGARQAFGTHSDPSVIGQFDPIKLSELIVERRPAYPAARQRELVRVGVYRGLPSSTRDPDGSRAALRQAARWRDSAVDKAARLEVHLRPLRYLRDRSQSRFRGVEQGIDVLLALALAFGAANGDFDVAVLFSGDSDLLPALERADAFGVTCEAASWGRRQATTAQEELYQVHASASTARLRASSRSFQLPLVAFLSRLRYSGDQSSPPSVIARRCRTGGVSFDR